MIILLIGKQNYQMNKERNDFIQIIKIKKNLNFSIPQALI